MSTREQKPTLPATLPPVLLAALEILPLGTRGGLRCVSSPTPNTSPGPLSIGITFSSGQPGNTILILCGRPGARFLRNLAFLRVARNWPFKFWLCSPGKPKICLIFTAPVRNQVPWCQSQLNFLCERFSVNSCGVSTSQQEQNACMCFCVRMLL